MATFNDVLHAEDIAYILSLSEVVAAKERIDIQTSGRVYFDIPLTETIKSAVLEKFGLDLASHETIPMRWIKGDTHPHIDGARTAFTNTYLVYLSHSPGEFVVGDNSYPIVANSGFRFSEGLRHLTQGTGETARLLLGPINEFADPVGASVIFFYPSEADALANTNEIANYGGYTIPAPGLVGGYTHWRLASNSTGPSPQNITYETGDTLAGTGSELYYLFPTAPCFREGTTILCEVDGVERYVPVETLAKDSRVKTSRDGFKKVVLVGKGKIINPGNDERIEDRLYKCSPSKYPALTEDLYITGCHSILEFPISEKQKEESIKRQGKLFVTDKKYRLMACVDERAEPWNSAGTYTIYHFALENADDGMNYGVYANGGLLVETCSIRHLKNKSNMTLV